MVGDAGSFSERRMWPPIATRNDKPLTRTCGTAMAHFKKSFPSRFTQAADFDNGPITVTIKSTANEDFGTKDNPQEKPVAFFDEDMRPVVLNITRCEAIAEIAGSEGMDDWPGTRVQLSKGATRFQGKKVACIDVSQPPMNSTLAEQAGF